MTTRRIPDPPPTQQTAAPLPRDPAPTAELEAIRTGLDPEQQCRAQAARAIGWQHPGDTDTADYGAWWWAEVDRLATWITTGDRP